MVFLDTDILVGLLRGEGSAERALEGFDQEGVPLRISVITAMELMHGALAHAKSHERMLEVKDLLSRLEIEPLDLPAARECSHILHTLRRKGSMVGLSDVQIAGTVLKNGDFLLTRNIKDFSRIAGLRIKKW